MSDHTRPRGLDEPSERPTLPAVSPEETDATIDEVAEAAGNDPGTPEGNEQAPAPLSRPEAEAKAAADAAALAPPCDPLPEGIEATGILDGAELDGVEQAHEAGKTAGPGAGAAGASPNPGTSGAERLQAAEAEAKDTAAKAAAVQAEFSVGALVEENADKAAEIVCKALSGACNGRQDVLGALLLALGRAVSHRVNHLRREKVIG